MWKLINDVENARANGHLTRDYSKSEQDDFKVFRLIIASHKMFTTTLYCKSKTIALQKCAKRVQTFPRLSMPKGNFASQSRGQYGNTSNAVFTYFHKVYIGTVQICKTILSYRLNYTRIVKQTMIVSWSFLDLFILWTVIFCSVSSNYQLWAMWPDLATFEKPWRHIFSQN